MIAALSSYSIFIPGFIALIRYSHIKNNYHPFIYLIWIGSINEVISRLLIWKGHFSILNNNIYFLLEALMITWFFMKMDNIILRRKMFVTLMILFTVAWMINMVYINKPSEPVFYFNIFYSFCIVLMSISSLNYLLIQDATPLRRQPLFWIYSGFILYFTLSVILHAFWLFGLNRSTKFLFQVAAILEWLNLFINLIYAYAFLWIPKKQPSLLHY
ncbi:MAG: hypothetical protein ACJ748_04755 [Flavisolibacter sp.]